MSEFQPSCQNGTPGFFSRSWSGWHHYQVIGAAETIILPCLIGIICSTGLVGNILIAFTIIRTQKKTIPDICICSLAIADLVHIIGVPFLIHQWLALVQPFCLTHLRTRSKTIRVNFCLWVASLILMFPVWLYSKVIKFKDGLEGYAFDLTSPDDVLWHMLYLTITTFFFPLPLIFICYILILCSTWKMYQQNKKAGNYTTSITRQRAMRLTKMVLALVSVSVVSPTPFHVIQLMNLQVSQLTLTFYVSYYISICLSYTSSSINPFPYILPTGNFQKCLQRVTQKWLCCWNCINVKLM
uniref:Melanin concentrating hormone receptor 2 n=1 Tax=Buteo japonicus TaxID=224669 RepID=A0A8C0AUV2_9AVES